MKYGLRFLIGTLVTLVLAAALALLAAGGQGALAQTTIIYVDADATSGMDNGTSWEDAFLELQDALDAAVSGDEIWVAAGSYRPTVAYQGTGDRFKSFRMKNSVAIYGGFDPTVGDITWGHRNWEGNVTILSGDLNGDDGPNFENNGENSYHVFNHSLAYLDSTAELDGFIISGGNANLSSDHSWGAGMKNYLSSSPTLRNVSFTGNAAGYGAGMANMHSSPTLINCRFARNIASNAGAGGMLNYSGSSPNLTDCTFEDNSAGTVGGGMWNDESSPTLTNCRFVNNTAGSNGGGMFNRDSSPTLTNCVFAENSAFSGGGMFSVDSGSTLMLTGCTFSGNSAGEEGGGMLNLYSSPTLTGCTFSGNSAYSNAGGMHNWGSSPTLTDCTFSDNNAWNGGGVANFYSSPELTGCTFSGNWAEGDGGGMTNMYDSSPVLTDCEFSDNSAEKFGGGMWNVSNSSPTLTGCVFSINSAGEYGGGMYNSNSSPTLTGCAFESNSAFWQGGGMYNGGGSAPALTSCAFVENYGSDGGGMANDESSPTLRNCTFWNNLASGLWGSGGGLLNANGSAPVLTNCTFSENKYALYGTGGAIANSYSMPTLSNCILWGDKSPEIHDMASSPVVTYSDVEGGYIGAGNIDVDPLFVDPVNGNLHLGSGSQCIDAGSNGAPNLPNYDFEGDPRKLDGNGDGWAVVDMGVDEYVPLHPVPLIVIIDITPSVPSNVIKLSTPRPVPVAILTTDEFDAVAEVAYDMVAFAGAPHVGYEVADVDDDDDLDLLLYFYPEDMVELTLESKDATLTGETLEGGLIEGTDKVKVRE